MHDALSVGRTHAAKGLVVGYFMPYDMEEGEEGDEGKRRNQGRRRAVVIERPTGQFVRTIGQADRKGRLWLLPEEVVWLVERGSLDVRYRGVSSSGGVGAEKCSGVLEEDEEVGEGEGEVGKETEEEEEEEGGWDGVSLSLQACYAWFVGRDGLDLERYTVYAGLRRSGYVVLRGGGWYDDDDDDDYGGKEASMVTPHQREQPGYGQKGEEETERWGIWHFLYKSFLEAKPKEPPPLGPLVGKGLFRNYRDIYRLLQIIPYHDPTSQPTTTTTTSSSPNPLLLRPHFHVYKPTPNFRKSAPGPPDFHITVLSARDSHFPTLAQLDGLLASVPFAPPPENEGRSYQRLKHGWRNVVLAVVDQGVVSYIRVADAGFGGVKMYERSTSSGQGKRGARGTRGGGRGRGK
ncbi:MAG: hypothetical protein Q9219_001782 [cf. Caloplaca sp. 3 TL-2023]